MRNGRNPYAGWSKKRHRGGWNRHGQRSKPSGRLRRDYAVSWTESRWNRTLCASWLIVLVMAGVSLTGCSMSLNDILSQKPDRDLETRLAACMVERREIPDIPPNLRACLTKKPAATGSADERVISLLQHDKERQACATAVLAWHRKVQQAGK